MSAAMRFIFMGTPAFAMPTLAALHEAGHNIVAVYTQPPRPAGRGQKETPSPVQQYAQTHGLPVCTPHTLKAPDAQAQFAAHRADAAIVAAYGLLLPKAILQATRLGCINIHPSLLPRWRGAAPIQRTIMAGDRETGIVIMQMDEGLDTGAMLAIEHHAIPAGATAGQLHDMLAQHAAPLLLATLEKLQADIITPIPQAQDGVTYAKKITKEECRIHWNQPAETVLHHILGLSPTPGAYFLHQQEAIKILAATCDPMPTQHQPGEVVAQPFAIACNPGVLTACVLQRPGKKRMEAHELARGFSIPVGTVLE